MIRHEDTLKLLDVDWGKPFPICIPSYKRWDPDDNKTMSCIIANCDDEIQKNTYLFVRSDQADKYRENFDYGNIVALPESFTGLCLADTRQYICDYVLHTLGEPYLIDLDDDLTGLNYVYLDDVEDTRDRLSNSQTQNYSGVIRMTSAIARMAFEKYGCLLGSPHRSRFANKFPTSQQAFRINCGMTPRQACYVNAKGLEDKGIRRNKIFNVTGDDVGFVAEIASHDCDMFQINCVGYGFVDDSVNSVIRNDDNRRELAAYEESALFDNYPIKDFWRIPHRYEDGSYRFSDIDMVKYRKLRERPDTQIWMKDFLDWQRDENGIETEIVLEEYDRDKVFKQRIREMNKKREAEKAAKSAAESSVQED